MQKKLTVWLKSMLTILIIGLTVSTTYATDTQIRLGYSDEEAFPFQIRHDANPPGIAMEIINQVAKDIGIEIIYLQLPNKRVLRSLLKGDVIDGAFMYSFKTERETNGKYPMKDGKLDEEKRLTTLTYYIYKLKKSLLKWDGNKFSGVEFNDMNMRIGANMGYSIVGDLQKMGIEVDEGAKKTDQNFKKLLNGRIVGYAHQDLVADNYLKTNRINVVEKISIPLSTKPYFLMFSHQFIKQNPQMAEKIWTRIAEIRDTVTKEVVHKYSK
ncbi:MAG: transporter substrate-binding domain-containing protein [Desulfamplus sp.]|nr:transporter substrate-binding domain-containing protein [Desulfamplus sp.]